MLFGEGEEDAGTALEEYLVATLPTSLKTLRILDAYEPGTPRRDAQLLRLMADRLFSELSTISCSRSDDLHEDLSNVLWISSASDKHCVTLERVPQA